MKTAQFLTHIESFLREKNIPFEKVKTLSPSCTADIFAKKTGRSLGFLFPYEDYYFFHDLSGRDINTKESLISLHEAAREYADSFYRLPKALRYKVPNILTVAVSDRSFSIDMVQYAKESTHSVIGGEKHSLYLVDLINKHIVSQGLEVTYSGGTQITFNQVNPTNRSFHLVHEMTETIL
ncbi:MAG: hypothetical protein GY754_25125 [bacterium]|nr:hypothetical protein [bacterium]